MLSRRIIRNNRGESRRFFFAAAALFALSALSNFASAQWKDQAIQLEPGWNAVYLEVQPQPDDSATVFASIPQLESAWAWNRRFSSAQFLLDADDMLAESPEWLAYFPNAPESLNTDLHIIEGGRPYLIKLGGSQTVNWTVRGRPVVRRVDWMGDSFNLVGFCVEPGMEPTFADFFAPSAAHAALDIHRLDVSGEWQPVAPGTDRLGCGEAYWVFCEGQSRYSGPLTITLEQAGAVDFGRTLDRQTLIVENHSGTTRTARFENLPSLLSPDPNFPLVAGEVLMSRLVQDLENPSPVYAFQDISGPFTLDVEPGQRLAIQLAPRRADFADPGFGAPEEGMAASYQSVLNVTDGAGSMMAVPVASSGMMPEIVTMTPPDARTGLWVGTAVINAVSEPANAFDQATPFPTSSEAQFRLIVHVDKAGQARLLKQAYLQTKPGSRDGNGEVVAPLEFVLVTEDSLIAQFSGSALRDGEQVGRRMSSAGYSWDDAPPAESAHVMPLAEMAAGAGGTFGAGRVLGATLALGHGHPTNPFKHRYHPDHDNLNERFDGPLQESYDLVRAIELEFTATDPEGLASLPGWGDNNVGGVYRETISGIHRVPVNVSGFFRLRHVSRIGELNDGQ